MRVALRVVVPRMQTVARFQRPRITMARPNWRMRRVEGSGIVKSESLLKIADDAEHTWIDIDAGKMRGVRRRGVASGETRSEGRAGRAP